MSLFKRRSAKSLPPLRFRNTLSGKVEVFEPLSPPRVFMYNCGPTVYSRVHIGNLRSYVFADTLRRALNYWGYRVKQVINITDVGHLTSDADEGEDKMEIAAQKEKRSARDIADEYTKLFFDDLDLLDIDRTNIEWPRATDYIPEEIALVKALEQKGYAYRTKDGVYFDASRFPAYGRLGGIILAGLKEGARVEENPEKHGPHDFALWKLSGRTTREQEWDSPWGKGFPGWHIECTAMIFKLLGKQIDIHTGGVDHIPIHHNNEIAQGQAITGKPYAKYWMHNEFITIEGRKISKSLGNSIYLRQLMDRGTPALALRYWFLTAHYRSPANFTWEALAGASAARDRLLRAYVESGANTTARPDRGFMRDFLGAFADDLNTPQALARVWDLLKDDSIPSEVKHASLREADTLLGLGLSDARAMIKVPIVLATDELPAQVRALIAEREAARAEKDFMKADNLREQVRTLGYEIEDSATGPKVVQK